ncbi:MAG: ABC transporter ATP-binding protein [Oscillibacter sp.]|nr:ABC transporter ATP-binding protein [Oscillibacter sp.]
MLSTKQVAFGVSDRPILRGIDFQAGPGEFVGIIGPNGSGKSTFLKQVYKVLRPQGGEIRLLGADLLSMSNWDMAQKLAVVVQEHECGFDFTVEEVVMMGRQARKRLLEADSREDRAMVDAVLERTRLAGLREQGFSTLSGGEKQRVLIARALVQQTDVLILDEPTNHLDIKYQLQLMDLVKALGCTVVAAIHDLNLAAMYCDRLYALKDGRAVCSGTPQELLTPERLSALYEVDAEVIPGPDGKLRVFFRSGR